MNRNLAQDRNVRILVIVTVLVIAALAVMNLVIASNLREDSLRGAEIDLRRHSLTLAGQADRTFQSIELIMSSVAEYVDKEGVVDSDSYTSLMSGKDTHLFLKGKLAGLPQLEAITMINANGKLLNFSRYWPIPDVNVSDRDYFKILSTNPQIRTFIGEPVQNRGSGTWNIYIARRVNGPNGEFTGLILAAMALQYFEDFYKSITLSDGSAESLLRDDGTLLARFPNIGGIGRQVGARRLLDTTDTTVRELSPMDGKMRIKASRRLTNVPMIVLSTQTEESVLQEWRKTVKLLAAFTCGMILLVIIGAIIIARQWRQQGELARIRAEKAEAERAKAMAQAELLRAKEQTADAANRAKSNFLAMMSHEIRTPMNAVLGLADALLGSRLEPDQRRSVHAIHEAGDNLLEILNDILDFSKLESGVISMESVPFSPRRLAESAITIVNERAVSKGLVLRLDVADEVPAAVLGDAGRLRQVVLNLVTNAIKFTEHGEVSVRIERLATGDATPPQARLRFSIIDTGVGIPPDRIGALFQDFVQVDSSISRKFGGSGLGLAISRRIVEQLNGTIGVQSELSVGSTFSFELTLPVSDRVPAAMSEASSAAGRDIEGRLAEVIRRAGPPLRVLIVDDNATNRMVAAKMLSAFDVKLAEAVDGLDAIEAVDREEFDLILMDMQMPQVDGLTATSSIRALGGRYATVPIIAFTANAFAEDRDACTRAGMNDFVAKPVRKALLLEAILRVLGDRREEAAPDAVGSIAPPAAPEAVAEDRFDPDAFTNLAAELDEESALETFKVFVSDADERITVLGGEAALANRKTVQVEAHSLKSTAATFGFVQLSELAKDLEHRAPGIEEEDFNAMVSALRTAFEAGKRQFTQAHGVAA